MSFFKVCFLATVCLRVGAEILSREYQICSYGNSIPLPLMMKSFYTASVLQCAIFANFNGVHFVAIEQSTGAVICNLASLQFNPLTDAVNTSSPSNSLYYSKSLLSSVPAITTSVPSTPSACMGVGAQCTTIGQFFLHPTNCSMYLECVNGATLARPCGTGTVFDISINNCNFQSAIPGPCKCT